MLKRKTIKSIKTPDPQTKFICKNSLNLTENHIKLLHFPNIFRTRLSIAF